MGGIETGEWPLIKGDHNSRFDYTSVYELEGLLGKPCIYCEF